MMRLIVLLIIVSPLFQGCIINNNGYYSRELIGEWECTSYDIFIKNGSEKLASGDSLTVIEKVPATKKIKFIFQEDGEYQFYYDTTFKQEGNYKIRRNGKTLKLYNIENFISDSLKKEYPIYSNAHFFYTSKVACGIGFDDDEFEIPLDIPIEGRKGASFSQATFVKQFTIKRDSAGTSK